MTKGIDMELRDYIAMGEEAAGGNTKLALHLGIARNSVTNAKAHQRGLPLPVCFKLADLIGVPRDTVAAASALVTEKDEKVREYLRPFAQNVSRAAGVFMTIACGVMFWTAPGEAKAQANSAIPEGLAHFNCDKAPSPAPLAGKEPKITVCIMSNLAAMRKGWQKFKLALGNIRFQPHFSVFVPQVG